MKANDRFVPPIMFAFRDAFRKRDARKPADERDADGERIIAGRRATPRNMVGETMLRQELSDDLGVLLNTVSFGSCESVVEFPHAARSILNYGLTDLSSIALDEGAVDGIAGELRNVLSEYEPRLIAESITVERDTTVDPADLQVRFRVYAEMVCTPSAVPVEFVADFEADSGKMKISRL